VAYAWADVRNFRTLNGGEPYVLHSVIIGINKYSDPKIPGFRSARSDAEAVSLLLREGIVTNERTVKTLLDEQATRRAVVEAVGEVLPRTQNKGDLVLIYFAGHGSPEQENPPDKIARPEIGHQSPYRSRGKLQSDYSLAVQSSPGTCGRRWDT
jgi:hypothetical protein